MTVKIESLSQITDPRQMAESHIYTPTEEAAFYQRYLEKEGVDGLRKLLSDSDEWPEDIRRALDEALARTPRAVRYATRLASTEDQIKFLDRMLALGYSDSCAARNFVENASTQTLNNIASRLHDLSNLGAKINGDRLGSGMYFLKAIAERTDELTPDAQKMFAKSVDDFNLHDKADVYGNEVFRRQILQAMLVKDLHR